MKGHILIVEDDAELSQLMIMYLEKEGFTTVWASSAEEAEAYLQQGQADLILLDLNLPGQDGFEFLGQLRRGSSTPVLIQSAREADEDVVLGLGLGADEYISKPVSPKVLVARVRAILRRVRQPDQESFYTFGEFQLDRRACNLRRGSATIPLSAREFEVLNFLASHPSQTHTPEALFKNIWAQDYGDVGTVGVYVQRIRKKLEEDLSQPRWIKTVRGKGYLFDPLGGPP